MRQTNKYSLEEIMFPDKTAPVTETKKEEPVSCEISALLSNASKTIGIVSWEKKVELSKKAGTVVSIKTSS